MRINFYLLFPQRNKKISSNTRYPQEIGLEPITFDFGGQHSTIELFLRIHYHECDKQNISLIIYIPCAYYVA